ncbi:hypothetical protein [Actinacidiphila yanglinensis]|nr:hypothetical protein [Actinacidiphila yanglinensis]
MSRTLSFPRRAALLAVLSGVFTVVLYSAISVAVPQSASAAAAPSVCMAY